MCFSVSQYQYLVGAFVDFKSSCRHLALLSEDLVWKPNFMGFNSGQNKFFIFCKASQTFSREKRSSNLFTFGFFDVFRQQKTFSEPFLSAFPKNVKFYISSTFLFQPFIGISIDLNGTSIRKREYVSKTGKTVFFCTKNGYIFPKISFWQKPVFSKVFDH